MPAIDAKEASKPGFQSSENTGVEVTIYSHKDDPIIFGNFVTNMVGKTQNDDRPSIVAVTTGKALNGAGTFSVTLKGPNRKSSYGILENVVDDDWIDIVFYQHNKPFHVLRGLIDDVRRNRVVSGSGATQVQYTISGRDFQKVWETTQIWFDRATAENVGGSVEYRVVGVPVNRSPREVVRDYLEGFLIEFAGLGRANWYMPKSMPDVGDTFIDSLNFITPDDPYGERTDRRAVNPNYSQAGGNLWTLATEWSDPLFCELFTDIVPVQGNKLGVMTVFYRMKQFPNIRFSPAKLDGPYYKALNTRIVPRQQVVADDLGRSGMERFNSFVVGSQTQQHWMGGAIEITRPLWNPYDMVRHGKRTFDIDSKYVPVDNDLAGISQTLRYLVRDWYCLNAYYLNGSINLGVGRPDIRIGEKIVIPGQDVDTDETYYVESVSHSWSLPAGTKTSLVVTRGYIGSDEDHMKDLSAVAEEYVIPPLGEPREATT